MIPIMAQQDLCFINWKNTHGNQSNHPLGPCNESWCREQRAEEYGSLSYIHQTPVGVIWYFTGAFTALIMIQLGFYSIRKKNTRLTISEAFRNSSDVRIRRYRRNYLGGASCFQWQFNKNSTSSSYKKTFIWIWLVIFVAFQNQSWWTNRTLKENGSSEICSPCNVNRVFT